MSWIKTIILLSVWGAIAHDCDYSYSACYNRLPELGTPYFGNLDTWTDNVTTFCASASNFWSDISCLEEKLPACSSEPTLQLLNRNVNMAGLISASRIMCRNARAIRDARKCSSDYSAAMQSCVTQKMLGVSQSNYICTSYVASIQCLSHLKGTCAMCAKCATKEMLLSMMPSMCDHEVETECEEVTDANCPDCGGLPKAILPLTLFFSMFSIFYSV